MRFYDKYDYQGIIDDLSGVRADKIWVCGEDIIYRAENDDGTFKLCRYGRFGVQSYNISIISDIIGDVEIHDNSIFYIAKGGTLADNTPEGYISNTDGSGKFPIMALAFTSISRSHIDGNVPDKEHFNEYLSRDLTNHFGGKINYILLRNQPTQVGVGYPHYYVWVSVSNEDGTVAKEGSARLNAMDKQGFAVTDFITKEQILENPYMLFLLAADGNL